MARFRGRQSRRERLLSNKAAIDFLAAGADKRYEFQVAIPKARKPRTRSASSTPLERDVLASALEALRLDRRVAFADRQQSGVFQDGDRYIRVGTPGKLDIVGMLKGGRYLELEAKRPGQKPDERQALRIAFVITGGGVSGYFTSVEEALALLP